MDARKRQQMLRAIDLANKHPAYAKTIGLEIIVRKDVNILYGKEEENEILLGLGD